MSREVTCKLLEAIDEELIDRDAVIGACVNYMSESDVADMCRLNDLLPDDEEEEEDDDEE